MGGFLQILRLGSIALLVLGLSACGDLRQPASNGYLEATPLDDAIKVGSTTKEEVARLYGSPSTVSAFPPETWYYVSSYRETVAFFEPELKRQKVARIEFDAAGLVSKYELLSEKDARDVNFVERTTPTEGRSLGMMEQFIGNIGKFNTPRDSTEQRQ